MASEQMPAQVFSMNNDSDDEGCNPKMTRAAGSGTISPPRQKNVQNFSLDISDEEDGAVTPPPPPLSPPRKAPQFFPLGEDANSEKSVSPAKSLRSVHHREGLGFSLCDDSDAEDISQSPIKKNEQPAQAATQAKEERSLDPVGLHRLGGARILGKHLAAVHKQDGAARTRSSAGSVASSVVDDDAASVASAVESVAMSEMSTTSKSSSRRRAQHENGAARLFGRARQAVKSEKSVDEAAAMIVEPDGVKGHVEDVMTSLSLRQRQEVQRHIDNVMRSAAERMGYRTLAEKQDLCERANNAICDALDRRQANNDCFTVQEEQEHSAPAVDREWDLALRAKIRLAMCAARERRTSAGLEEAIAAARSAAKQRSMAESQAYEDIETRILWAAHEAVQRRGGPAVAAEAARVPVYMSGVPARSFSRKPRVEIPAEKLDSCIQSIVTEAKARTEAKDQGSMSPFFCRGQRSHPLLRASLYNDAELQDYFKSVVADAAVRAARSEANAMAGNNMFESAQVYSEADKADGQDYSESVPVYSNANRVSHNYCQSVEVQPQESRVDGQNHSESAYGYTEASGVDGPGCCSESVEEVPSPRKWGGC